VADTGRLASGELFPTDEPVSGDALIGRDDDVDGISSSLMGSINTVLAGPRRIGKTSVAREALEVCRRAGAYTVALDLFKQADGIQLAESLAIRTLSNRPEARRLLARVRESPERAQQVAGQVAAVRLRQEFGDVVDLALAPGSRRPDPTRALASALDLLQAIAEADDRRVILFLDEFQEIAAPRKPYGEPRVILGQLRASFESAPRVTVVFAGSLEHVMRDLFGSTDQPLCQFGALHELPPIADNDWRTGIRAILKLDGCTIDDDALGELIARGERHSRATMLVAQQAHLIATLEPTHRVDLAHVLAGADRAMRSDRLKHEQTLSYMRALGRHAQRMAERVALAQKLYEGMPPDVANQTLRSLRDAGIIEHPARGEWRIIDPLLRRYLSELPEVAKHG